MSKNPIFQERKKISKNPSKKKIFTAKFIVKKNFYSQIQKKSQKNLKNFSSKKWLKIFEKNLKNFSSKKWLKISKKSALSLKY